jgi:hypothetical protein
MVKFGSFCEIHYSAAFDQTIFKSKVVIWKKMGIPDCGSHSKVASSWFPKTEAKGILRSTAGPTACNQCKLAS